MPVNLSNKLSKIVITSIPGITAALLFLLLASCQHQVKRRGPASVQPELSSIAAKKQWASSISGHSGYEMTYKVECTCDLTPEITVKVDKSGRVLAVKAVPVNAAPSLQDAITIGKLFKIIESTRASGNGSVLAARFSRITGAPEMISIDSDASATDDEERIVILKLKFD